MMLQAERKTPDHQELEAHIRCLNNTHLLQRKEEAGKVIDTLRYSLYRSQLSAEDKERYQQIQTQAEQLRGLLDDEFAQRVLRGAQVEYHQLIAAIRYPEQTPKEKQHVRRSPGIFARLATLFHLQRGQAHN